MERSETSQEVRMLGAVCVVGDGWVGGQAKTTTAEVGAGRGQVEVGSQAEEGEGGSGFEKGDVGEI